MPARVSSAIVYIRLAIETCVPCEALAGVVVEMVFANAAVLARVRGAFVNVKVATFTAIARPAVADELVEAIFAGSTVQTRVGGAFVDVAQTAGIVVTSGTFTFETVDEVYADTTIGARVGSALVDVRLAMDSSVARQAFARVPKNSNSITEQPIYLLIGDILGSRDIQSLPIDSVHAFCTISTGVAVALVDIDFAVESGRSWATAALISVDEILTVATILARG